MGNMPDPTKTLPLPAKSRVQASPKSLKKTKKKTLKIWINFRLDFWNIFHWFLEGSSLHFGSILWSNFHIKTHTKFHRFLYWFLDAFWLLFGSILALKIDPKMHPGHPWGTESPQKRAREPEDPQKACKMEPKLSPGPSKSTLWATISLPKCSQDGSRPPLVHMEPPEACPGAPEAPTDNQHEAKT